MIFTHVSRLALGIGALWLSERFLDATTYIHAIAKRCYPHGTSGVMAFMVLRRLALGLLWLSETMARWSLLTLPAPSDARREMLAWYDEARRRK